MAIYADDPSMKGGFRRTNAPRQKVWHVTDEFGSVRAFDALDASRHLSRSASINRDAASVIDALAIGETTSFVTVRGTVTVERVS